MSSQVEFHSYVIIFILCGEGCRDIDDALHCTALPNGNFEVGVRILCLLILKPSLDHVTI